MPSWELFESQPEAVKNEVLPPECELRLAIEAGVTLGWDKYIGSKGRVIGLNKFGLSGPYKVLAKAFGFTVENVLKVSREILS